MSLSEINLKLRLKNNKLKGFLQKLLRRRNHPWIHALTYSGFSLLFVYLMHHLPVNQLFIDPFSEAIKSHDIMDVAFSKFRDKRKVSFDSRIVIINSGITDRAKLAKTIDILNSRKAAAIGIDLILDTLYNTQEDSMLQQAISKTNNIVFGYIFYEKKGSHNSFKALGSNDFFIQDKTEAYVNLGTNDGFSVRAFEPVHHVGGSENFSFGLQLSALYDSTALPFIHKRHIEKEWINFKRVQPGYSSMAYPINHDGVVHYNMIHIDQLLNDTMQYDSTYFANKIVLIGFCGETEQALSMKDRYFTPLNEEYTGRSIPDMHGVTIHANIISMILDRDFICEVSHFRIYLYSFLLYLFNYFVYRRMERHNFFRSMPFIRLIQILEFFILLMICVLLLLSFSIKLGFVFIVTTVILSYELFELYEHKFKPYVQRKLDAFLN